MSLENENETGEDFAGRMNGLMENVFLGLSLQVGHRLKLFDLLAECTDEQNPKSPQELADKANLKERYVREWLRGMVAGRVVECDAKAEKFYLPKHRAPFLSQGSPLCMTTRLSFVPMFSAASEGVAACSRKDGPSGMPYSAYEGFHEFMAELSMREQNKNLIACFVPSIPGMKAALEKGGAKCLDVGCGRGVASLLLAKAFPKSEFYGFDIDQESMEFGQKTAMEEKLSNLHFETMDGTKVKAEWSGVFDFVTAFDAIHDQTRPDLALAEIFRILKPGGLFVMVDIEGTSNPVTDRNVPLPCFKYAGSLLHCLPVSLYFDGGLGVGTMWGEKLAREMLATAGFKDVQVLPSPTSKMNVHYLCRKPL